MERHGRLNLDSHARQRLVSASPATIDRLLKPIRETAGGRRKRPVRRKKASRQVPVRTFADWNAPPPGFLEIDLVAHCGGTLSGAFVHSLVAIDVCSGWTEAVPLLAREQSLVVEGLHIIGRQLPVPILGIDSDNDSVFINETLVQHCADSGIEFTRSRAYRKNDQAWIEQKNGAVIRRFVGYDRYTGHIAVQAGREDEGRRPGDETLTISQPRPVIGCWSTARLASRSKTGCERIARGWTPWSSCTPSDRRNQPWSPSPLLKVRRPRIVRVWSSSSHSCLICGVWVRSARRMRSEMRVPGPGEPGRTPSKACGLTSCSGCSRNRTLPPKPSLNACGLSTLDASPTVSSGRCNAGFANGGESWPKSSSMPLLTSQCRGALQQGRSLRLALTPEAQISVTFPDEATGPAKIVDAEHWG